MINWMKYYGKKGLLFCFLFMVIFVTAGCDPAYHKKFIILFDNTEKKEAIFNEMNRLCHKYNGKDSVVNDSRYICGGIIDTKFDKVYPWIGFETKLINDTIRIDLYQGMTSNPSKVYEDIELDLISVTREIGEWPNKR